MVKSCVISNPVHLRVHLSPIGFRLVFLVLGLGLDIIDVPHESFIEMSNTELG